MSDARNVSNVDLPTRVFGELTFGPDGAIFDGRTAKLEINTDAAPFDRGPFTLAARFNIDPDQAESLGDIASKFDPNTRSGFNLSIADHGGVTSSCANYRNLNFSVDSGTSPIWTDCGRPGNAVHICALTVHDGSLYAGTFEFGDTDIGRVFRYLGGQRWEDTGVPCKANSIFGMASINGVLYAASGRYDPRNSALDDTGNMNEESRIWRMERDGVWRDCGDPQSQENEIHNLGVYRGKLYATPSFSRGLYRYEGQQNWTQCAEPYPRFLSLCQWRGQLYGGSNKGLRKLGPPPEREITFIGLPGCEGAYRYNDVADTWEGSGPIPTETQMYGFCVHRGALYTSTWPSCKVFRSTTGNGWEDCGRLHPEEKESMAMCVYNGKMYVGTLPAADVYRYDGDQRWTRAGNVDQTPNVKYRRAWSMAVHDGMLFVGALPSGRVHSMKTGAVASDSRQLSTGWHSVVASFDGAKVKLYLDGLLSGESTAEAQELKPTNRLPLTIGFGSHDYYRGKMADLRLYKCALDSADAMRLSSQIESS